MTAQACVYCTTAEAATRDHVIERGFLPPDKRNGIPIVPACLACNQLKSRIEHYATTVVPFGATTQAVGLCFQPWCKGASKRT